MTVRTTFTRVDQARRQVVVDIGIVTIMVTTKDTKRYIRYLRTLTTGSCNQAYGVRPIVSLKSGIKTNVSKDQTYLDQTCWNLEI